MRKRVDRISMNNRETDDRLELIIHRDRHLDSYTFCVPSLEALPHVQQALSITRHVLYSTISGTTSGVNLSDDDASCTAMYTVTN